MYMRRFPCYQNQIPMSQVLTVEVLKQVHAILDLQNKNLTMNKGPRWYFNSCFHATFLYELNMFGLNQDTGSRNPQ